MAARSLGPKFINTDGVLIRQRSQYSHSSNNNVTSDPGLLLKILTNIASRITNLERRSQSDHVEFEVVVGTGGALTSITHNMNAPVRYTVTYWTRQSGGAYPTAAPILVADSTSTSNILVLRSHVAGRAVIRVERSNAGINA